MLFNITDNAINMATMLYILENVIHSFFVDLKYEARRSSVMVRKIEYAEIKALFHFVFEKRHDLLRHGLLRY